MPHDESDELYPGEPPPTDSYEGAPLSKDDPSSIHAFIQDLTKGMAKLKEENATIKTVQKAQNSKMKDYDKDIAATRSNIQSINTLLKGDDFGNPGMVQMQRENNRVTTALDKKMAIGMAIVGILAVFGEKFLDKVM